MSKVFVLVDEKYGEVQVFSILNNAKDYFEEIDKSVWTQDEKDDTFWHHKESEFLYIFKREII